MIAFNQKRVTLHGSAPCSADSGAVMMIVMMMLMMDGSENGDVHGHD